LIGKLRGKKIILDWDDLDSAFQTTKFRKRLTKISERFLPRYIDIITTHNKYLYSYAKKMGTTKVIILPQRIDTKLFDPANYDSSSIKEELGLSGKKVLGFLGTLTSGGARDLDVILEAFQKVIAVKKNVHLLIIGGGPLHTKFKAIIKNLNNVTITGFIPHNLIPRYVAVVDIGLVYQRKDLGNIMRMPFKLLEYLAMRKPVVGHLVGASYDQFKEVCYLCKEDGFEDDIIKHMEHIVPNKARDYIVNKFDARMGQKELMELIDGLL
jgi:glycosyltransferase involved in cell wall biosynthesis